MDQPIATRRMEKQFGFASNLRRHNAVMAEVKDHSMSAFAMTLAENIEDFVIDDMTNEGLTRGLAIEFCRLKCPQCDKEAAHTRALIEHLAENHMTTSERSVYHETNLVSPEINRILQEAMRIQGENSFARRKFANAGKGLIVRTSSPLFSFLALYHMKIFLHTPPSNKANLPEKIIQWIMKKDAENYKIFFVFTYQERALIKIREERKKKEEAAEMQELEKLCWRASITNEDIFFKKRNTEESDCLASALNLSSDYTKEQLEEAIKKATASGPLILESAPASYEDIKTDDGRLMSAEERRLISTLTTDRLNVTGAKRRCTQNKKYNC
ncbi:unnamed protein product [Caenorhabditis sp. 36 PRJEB53466]|nr:unnamed protein product [Caenorhabditis sp. 36 PRJEB53466]